MLRQKFARSTYKLHLEVALKLHSQELSCKGLTRWQRAFLCVSFALRQLLRQKQLVGLFFEERAAHYIIKGGFCLPWGEDSHQSAALQMFPLAQTGSDPLGTRLNTPWKLPLGTKGNASDLETGVFCRVLEIIKFRLARWNVHLMHFHLENSSICL